MTYAPPPHMRPAIPDFSDLPTTIRLPHARRMPMLVLVIASICLMISAFSGVWMPIIWGDISIGTQAIITMFMVVASLGSGTAALRRYASEDEVTIDIKGVKQRVFTWLGTKQSTHGWDEFQSVIQSQSATGYHILELVFRDDKYPAIAVFVAKNHGRIKVIKQQIEKWLGAG